MAENKLRKHYRDKFRRKFGMKASQVPYYSSEAEYERLYNRILYEEQQKDFYLDELVKENLIPDEVDYALEKIEEMFKKFEYSGVLGDELMYPELNKLYRKFKRMDKSLKRRLIRNASAEAIEAVEDMITYFTSESYSSNEDDTGVNKKESGVVILNLILSGGEIPSMNESFSLFQNGGNYETV